LTRPRIPDIAQARSLVEAAEQEMLYLDTLKPTLDGAQTIIRGIYENFRRLGKALLSLQGISGSHEDSITALTSLRDVKTSRPIQAIDNLRTLRNNINYLGYHPSQADLDDVISIKKACWVPVLSEVKKLVYK
jgi:hypothetical protein